MVELGLCGASKSIEQSTSMLYAVRTDSDNEDFRRLVQLLNSDLATRDGADHPLAKFNSIDEIKYAILICDEDKPIGCGAITHVDDNTMELKRIYVIQEARGKKVGY